MSQPLNMAGYLCLMPFREYVYLRKSYSVDSEFSGRRYACIPSCSRTNILQRSDYDLSMMSFYHFVLTVVKPTQIV